MQVAGEPWQGLVFQRQAEEEQSIDRRRESVTAVSRRLGRSGRLGIEEKPLDLLMVRMQELVGDAGGE